MHVPVVYYHDNVETHTHAHTHTSAENKEHLFKSRVCRSETEVWACWAVLGSSSGHAALTPCLAVGWCIWAKCVSLQQDILGVFQAEAEEKMGSFLGNVC